jgi:hypothetical protein
MKSFFTLIVLLQATLLFAGPITKTNVITGTAITTNATVETSGPHYSSPTPQDMSTRTWWIENTYGLVQLSFPIPATGIRPTGNAKVVLKIDYQTEVNGQYVSNTVNKELSLSLASTTATDVAYFKIDGAQYVKATVLTGTTIPADFTAITLATIVETNTFEKLEKLDDATVKATLNPAHTLTSDGNLKINWSTLTGAESYHLEWTYGSDQHPDDRAQRLSPNAIEVDRLIFKNNSSRVEVTGTSYEIPLIYERGIILYRLRGVGKNVANSTVVPFTTEWTVPDGTVSNVGDFPHSYVFNGHEEDLNWQSSLNFAEEAKSKVLVSYFDGSSRNRQAVTRINTDRRSVVGETFYDFNGRPTIQLLPVPVKQNKLSFYPQFNLMEINGQNKVEKAAYDKAKEGSGAGCELVAPTFSTDSGASQYYSPNNSFDTLGNIGGNLLNKKLIPDAEKYPYTQTIYTPDNTGRVGIASGLGFTHQVGKKDTRMFYGTPSQPEISRLLGMQAGYAGHYKKNATIDPNGQTSVSYLDLNGKVVATALAGAKPDNLTGLDETNTKTVSTQLIEEATNVLAENKLSFVLSKKFLVTGRTNYTFRYTGSVGTYNLSCSNSSSSFNFKEAITFNVSLFDKCKTPLFLQNGCSGCNTNSSPNFSMPDQNVTLDPGEYQLSKTLKIDEDALEAYFQNYLNSPNSCILARDSFSLSEKKKVNISGCGMTCQQCKDEIEKVINTGPTLSPQEQEVLRASCNFLCDDQSFNCKAALQAMRGDMSPGGQYAQLRKEKLNLPSVPEAKLDANNQAVQPEVDVTIVNGQNGVDPGNPDDDVINVENFPLSIFNENNSLTVPKYLQHISDKAYWKYPVSVLKPSFDSKGINKVLESGEDLSDPSVSYFLIDYNDINGNIYYATVYLSKDENGVDTYLPKIDAEGVTRKIPVDADKGIYKVPVRNLESVADFEKYWLSHWADYLVPYHPEYGYLKQCTSEKTSQDFDYQLINANTVALAKQQGFIDTNDKPDVLSKDLLVQNNADFKSTMTSKDLYYKQMKIDNIDKVRSMAEVATITVNCPRLETACGNGDCADGKLTTDEEWMAYKAFYFAEKLILLKKRANKIAVDSFYYNGCIGHSDFMSNDEASYFKQPVIKAIPIQVTTRGCYKNWSSNYKSIGYSCNNGTFTIYKNEKIYPYNNPAQVCNKDKDQYYEKKTQRFYPQTPKGIGGNAEIIENCSTYVQGPDNQPILGPDNQPIMVTFVCAEDAKALLDNAVEDAQRFKYSSCGLCPLASDLNDFLQLLKKNNKLVSPNPLIVSCDDNAVRVGEALRGQLTSLSPLTSPAFYWKTSINGNLLTGEFSDGTNVLAKIQLAIPNGYDSRVNFTNLGKLCCMNIVPQGQNVSFPYEEGKIFSINALNIFTKQEFRIEGKFDLQIATCNIPPKCLVTDDASHIVLFLNALADFTTEIPTKLPILNTNNVETDLVRISGQVNQLLVDFYSAPVRAILGKDNEDTQDGFVADITTLAPKWKSSVLANGNFEGELSHVNGSIVIDITGLESQEYALVDDIYNLRPNKPDIANDPSCGTQNCLKQSFLADVKVVENNQVERKTITITVPAMNPVSCKAAKKALLK